VKEENPPHNQPPLLTAKEAAAWARQSVRTIYNYCQPGADPQIPHIYGPGGKILIVQDALRGWLERFKARPRRKRRK
jgi:Helix-turn-helix domain